MASRVISAWPRTIYTVCLDAELMMQWRPPAGMTGKIYEFDPRIGGSFRLALRHIDGGPAVRGKSSDDEDVIVGRFVDLVPDARIVEEIEFESDDPTFAGVMTVTTTFIPVSGGTEVTIRCDNVPSGISAEEHQLGINSTLQNLARFTE